MAALALPAKPLGATLSWKVAVGLTIAALIAWVAPFDRAFDAITFGIPALRSALIVALAVTGAILGQRVGLNFGSRPGRAALLVPLAAAVAVGMGCALIDVLMRRTLHSNYLHFVTTMPLDRRIIGYTTRAFNENIIYRLFLASLLAWLIGQVWHSQDGRPTMGAFWTAFILAQVINIAINVTVLAPITPLSLLHDALRYAAPGLVWSWLYWRYGFQSNEIACTSVHLVLQPLLSLGMA